MNETKYEVSVEYNGDTLVETDLTEDYNEADKIFEALCNVYVTNATVYLRQYIYENGRYVCNKLVKYKNKKETVAFVEM